MTENSKWKPVGGIAEAARSPSQPINKLFSENEAILNYIINRDKKSRSSPDAAIIGLEYIVEIQPSDITKGCIYSCRLCDEFFDRPGEKSIKDVMKHLGLLSHKLQYLQKHFSLIKEQRLTPPKNECREEKVDQIVQQIEAHFGRLKIVVVEGLEKYRSKIDEIDREITKGDHFNEDSNFLKVLFDTLLTSASSELRKLQHSSRRPRGRSRSRDRKRRKENSPRINRSKSRSRKKRKTRSRSKSRSSDRYQGSSGKRDLRDKIRSKKKDVSRERSRSKSLVITVRKSRSRSKDRRKESKERVFSKGIIHFEDHGNIVHLSDEESNSLQEKLMEEKVKFLANPNDHPEYQSRWRKFWSKKHKVLGSGIKDANLIPEWTTEWRLFLDDEYQRKLSAKDPKKNASVRSEGKAELVTLSDESNDEVKYQPPPIPEASSSNTPSTSRVAASVKSRSHLESQTQKSLVKIEKLQGRNTYQVPKEDFSVLNLINILSALNSKGLMMEDLGSKLQKIKSLALSLEERGHGDSKLLVDEKECFNFVDQCQETLKQKLKTGLVAESHKRTVQIGLDLIEMFISQSSCQKSDILEIACFSPVPSEDEPITKIKIAEAIEAELHGCSKKITQEEFNSLVEAEYIRVKNKIYPKIVNPHHQPYPTSSGESQAVSNSQHFSAYANPPTISGIRRIEQRPTSTIDWDSIIKALQVAKDQSNTPPATNPHINVQSNDVRQKPPTSSVSDQLSEDEIVALVKHINQLPGDSKQELLEYMKQIEQLDPMKAYRIKQKVKE